MDTVTVGLLERDAQLASLTGYAGEARHGDGRLVLVAGEAGVGKSALVEQAQRDLPAARWFWGACDGLFTPRPLGPLFDIASKLGGELLELCRADAPREDLFRALLRQISEPAELHVLVMEDVHWADEATVDLLRFLGRRLRDAPVLLIATYRDDGLTPDDPLRVALGDLATQRSTRRIGLVRRRLGLSFQVRSRYGCRVEARTERWSALQFLGGQSPEPAFDEVEPGRAGRGVKCRSKRGCAAASVSPPGLVGGDVVEHRRARRVRPGPARRC